MIEVIPLKYGVTFKRVFSQPEIFKQFIPLISFNRSLPPLNAIPLRPMSWLRSKIKNHGP